MTLVFEGVEWGRQVVSLKEEKNGGEERGMLSAERERQRSGNFKKKMQ
jgi:hypothetical protein